LEGPGESLKSFREAWDKAESRIKRTERLRTSLTIPAVNELRYAGYHLLRSVVHDQEPDDGDTPQESLKKGILHCRRATYDAVDAEAMLYLERAKKFEEEFLDISVDMPGFDYMSIRKQIRLARDLMAAARGAGESRDSYHQKMIDQCEGLRSSVDSLDDARIELTKKKERMRAEDDRFKTAEKRSEAAEHRADVSERRAQNLEKSSRRNFYIMVLISVLTGASGWAKVYLDRTSTAIPHTAEIQSASDAGR
jgi:DNA repair exonuclease SbcCD ATPase subunit